MPTITQHLADDCHGFNDTRIEATFSTSSLHNSILFCMPSTLFHPCPCLFCPSLNPCSYLTALPHSTASLRISSSSGRFWARHIAMSHDMWLSVWHSSLAVAAALDWFHLKPVQSRCLQQLEADKGQCHHARSHDVCWLMHVLSACLEDQLIPRFVFSPPPPPPQLISLPAEASINIPYTVLP